MIFISNEHGMIRVDLSGDLNRDNILSIRQNIMESLQPGIRSLPASCVTLRIETTGLQMIHISFI